MRNQSNNNTSQLALNLSHDASHLRADLIESSANATAIAMIDAWPEWPGSATVLAGPVGSGKTHIASVWAGMSNALMVDAQDLKAEAKTLLDEISAGKCLVIENMAERTVDETILFHILNSIRESGGYCLITSRSWPVEWQVELPDLVSRLKAMQLIELEEPDDLLLKQVMMKLFSDRQLQVDASVVEYCALRMERSLETAARLVAKMDELALSQRTTIGRKIASKALASMGMA